MNGSEQVVRRDQGYTKKRNNGGNRKAKEISNAHAHVYPLGNTHRRRERGREEGGREGDRERE